MIGPVGLFWQPVVVLVDTVLCMLIWGNKDACLLYFVVGCIYVPVTCDHPARPWSELKGCL